MVSVILWVSERLLPLSNFFLCNGLKLRLSSSRWKILNIEADHYTIAIVVAAQEGGGGSAETCLHLLRGGCGGLHLKLILNIWVP